jgi:hypothetical protein
MSDTLWRINPGWVTYTKRTEQDLVEYINNEYGVHGEGVDSMVPLVPVEMEDGGSGVYEEHSDPAYIGRRFQIWFEHPDGIGGDDEKPR